MTRVESLLAMVTHKHSDLFFLLVCSVLLVGYELWSKDWALALFAATLGAFAVSMIRLRRDVGAMHASRSGLSSIFMDTSPTDLSESMREASELLLIGVSLDRTLRSAYTPLEVFLGRGGLLRVLLVDPRSEWSVKIADRRAYDEQGVEARRGHILSSIKRFLDLSERTGGKVEIRVTDDPLVFGATMIDGAELTNASRIVIQHYSFKKREAKEPNPVFVVRPSDEKWFADFHEELENLWRSGIAWRP